MIGMNNKALISGDNLIHALDFIKRKKGEEGLNWVVCDIGSDINDIFPEKMYPFERYTEILEIIKGNFDDSDAKIISRIGFDRAKNLSFFEFHKKKTDPITIFSLIQKHWDRFNAFGRIAITNKDDSSATIYICDYEPHPLYCERMEGFLNGIIDAICYRKNGYVKETKCLAKGDEYCKFEASWREPN